MSKKTDTINLKGKDYAKVATRIKELHEKYNNASIDTDYDFKEGWAICKAILTLDTEQPERVFTGHSMGRTGKDKAFEKLETVAVGRALANAGFLASGEIATAEEMQKFGGDEEDSSEGGKMGDSFKAKTEKVNADAIIKRLEKAEDKQELKSVWSGLNMYAKNNEAVKKCKEELKKELS